MLGWFEHRVVAGLGEEELLVGALVAVLGQQPLEHDELGEAPEAQAPGEEDLGHTADGELLEEYVSAELRLHRGSIWGAGSQCNSATVHRPFRSVRQPLSGAARVEPTATTAVESARRLTADPTLEPQ